MVKRNRPFDVKVKTAVLADYLDISVQYIIKMSQKGTLPKKDKDGHYILFDAVLAYVRFMKSATYRKAGDFNQKLNELKLRHLEAQSRKIEIANNIKLQELIPMSLAKEMQGDMIERTKTQLMSVGPSLRVNTQISEEYIDVVELKITEALEQLSLSG